MGKTRAVNEQESALVIVSPTHPALLSVSLLVVCVKSGCVTCVPLLPRVCPGCQEGQWFPGVHEEESVLQVKGGSPSPLLCPSEAPSGVLCPVLGSPAQER